MLPVKRTYRGEAADLGTQVLVRKQEGGSTIGVVPPEEGADPLAGVVSRVTDRHGRTTILADPLIITGLKFELA